MGRKTRRSGGSTGSVENEVVTTASAKEPVAESGRRRVSSGSSSVTDSPKSSNTPASKSRPKRGSSEFNKPTPKKKSAYARLLENKQSSNDDDVGTALTSPSNAAKKGKGLKEDPAEKFSPSHGEASSGRRTRNTSVSDAEASSGRPTRHCKAPSHDEASSGSRTRNSKSVGEPPEARIESVEVELVSNKTSPKKSESRSDRGRANATIASPDAQVSANDGTSPKSSIKHSPTLNNQVDVNEERLRKLEIETGVADTNRGAIDSTTG